MNMRSKEFTRMCIPYNRMYHKIFGTIPSPRMYAGTQEEFFAALQKSIETKKPIDEYLRRLTIPTGEGILL